MPRGSSQHPVSKADAAAYLARGSDGQVVVGGGPAVTSQRGWSPGGWVNH
jgi:hypothetical protein